MKRIFAILAVMIAVGLFTGCNEDDKPQPVDTNEYYVKYAIVSYYGNSRFGNVSYEDVNGTSYDLVGQYVRSWSVTIGPVKKGFKAYVRNGEGAYATNTIEVSKNGDPFIQKAKGMNSALYVIDY